MGWRTRALGAISVSAAAVLIGAELARVWRLGRLPLTHGADPERLPGGPRGHLRAIREGYGVSSTRENAIVNMLAGFMVTFAGTRTVTYAIRERGRLGPIRDVIVGVRHIHHFIPGMAIAFVAGGFAIGLRPEGANRWLAVPFGMGIALVADETALLLELEDVYWSEEGMLSLETAFAALGLLAAIAYAIQVRRRGAHSSEADWRAAAEAWEGLEALPGATRRAGP